MSDTQEQVSVEDAHGRVLTGVGVTPEALEATVERFAPDPESAPVEPPATAAPTESAQKKPSRGQSRFSQLTSERDQEAHKRAEAERERDDLRARLSALENRPAAAAEPVAPAAPTAPKFTYPTFDAAVAANPALTWDDWNDGKIEARAKWEVQQAQGSFDAQIRSSIEADRASRAYRDTLADIGKRGRASIPDFDAMQANGPGVRVMLGPSPESGEARIRYIASLPNAEHVFHAIASSADVANTLARMNDVQFGMALTAIAPAPAVASPASTAGAGSVTVPPPYQPVGSGAQTTVTPSADLPKKAGFDFDKSGYRERRAAERGVTRRR